MEKKQVESNKNCGPFNGSGTIWADDKTDVYIGNCKEITSKPIASQTHPKPSSFEFQGNCCDYLYFICWSNDGGVNGFLAQLQGDNPVFSGSSDWEVFATGKNKGINDSVSIIEINQELERACKEGWKTPFIGPSNNQNNGVLPYQNSISNNANFIWHDSRKDPNPLFPSSPYVPFRGFNHDEFLIFRVPIHSLFIERCYNCQCEECDCSCDCGCDGCNKKAKEQDQELIKRANKKFHTLANHPTNPPSPFETLNCRSFMKEKTNIVPFIYLHWGDSSKDVIENHDTEIIYLTVCNPYKDVEFKGFRITKINLIPKPGQQHQARIIPDRFINYDCLAPCSCKTREFTLLTRDELNQYIDMKNIEIEYCWEDTVLTKNVSYGSASFPIDIIKDED